MDKINICKKCGEEVEEGQVCQKYCKKCILKIQEKEEIKKLFNNLDIEEQLDLLKDLNYLVNN